MRVLITGATGLLGSTLAGSLQAGGYSVIRHGRTRGEVTGDLTDARSAEGILAACRPEVVVHLAALTNVDQCEHDPQLAYLINTRAVENIAGAIARDGVAPPYLIHVSTDQLYDGNGPHVESAVVLQNYYAFSKYAGELAARAVRSTVLRTNFFGRSELPERKSFSDWIVEALTRGDPVKVFEDVLFSPLSIERLAALIRLTLERRIPGVFNVGSRDGMSKADFCFALARLLDLPTAGMTRARVQDAELPAHRPRDMRMDPSLFESTFAVRMPTLEQELQTLKRYYHACS